MLKTLVKIRIKLILSSLFNKGKKRGKGMALIIFGFAYYMFIVNAIVIPSTGAISGNLIGTNISWLAPTLPIIMAFALCFIGSVFLAYQQIYESKDNEMILAMPVKPSQILISRIFAIAGFNFLYALPFFTGTVVGLMITNSARGILSGAFLLFDYLAMVAFVTMLTCICAWMLSLFLSKIKNNTLISSVIYIFFFGVYFYGIMQVNKIGDVIIKHGEEIASGISSFAWPFYTMGVGATEHNIFKTLVFITIMMIPSVAIFWIMEKSYIRILLKEKFTKKVEYKESVANTRTVKRALLQKEISKFVKTPMYFLNYGSSTLFVLLVIFYLILKKDKMEDVVELLSVYGVKDTKIIPGIFTMIMYQFAATSGILTSASINLEGKTLWILKSLPISTKDIFFAKIMVPIVCLWPVFFIGAVLSSVALSFPLLPSLLLVTLPCVTMIFFAVYGLYINLKHYKLDWINETEAFKRAGGPTIASFAAFGSLILIILFFLPIYFLKIMTFMNYLWIITGVLVVFTIAMVGILIKKGERLFRSVD
ncbi:hypothetical protein ACGCUQ_04810 [Eubacteriales bacterium KG127]